MHSADYIFFVLEQFRTDIGSNIITLKTYIPRRLRVKNEKRTPGK